ncbi:WecB/TagA/CpsF family glycosyltransferase [Pseudalkalibacillus salsuginis]|uniref:WecB/TagA/CpsF family glycosyltransferase n=1 Tax=Pseudalkalibacillus salsuginis TaxID=2910972 RepID=UPI001F2B5674|nr:WecB/TagA/CpsF family glycosyltransferase [Pseudalkalibacillus salsuginis]MCF6410110.1 WecB/TagA/CpsF family glycosyltransferase [Pseudalkalibacillus salsuginis]
MTINKVDVMGVPFVDTSMDSFIKHLHESHLEKESKAFVITANPEIVMYASEDVGYRSVLNDADYITPDGIGIVKAARILGTPIKERVSGFDIMCNLLQIANENRSSVYLLGTKEEVLQSAEANIQATYPNVDIIGSHNGYFDWDDNDIVNEIQQLRPDMIFVALGLPRQENWIAENIHHFDKGIFMGVGGSFDVFAGIVKRAPVIYQNLHLEWFYRLVKQPSRARRMLALPRFMFKVFEQKVKGKK